MRRTYTNQRGFAHLVLVIVLFLFVVGAATAAYFAVASDENDRETSAQQAAKESEDEDDVVQGVNLQANQRNTARRNDAALLLASAGDFVNSNSGSLPTGFDSTTVSLTGVDGTQSTPVGLGFYEAVTVLSGKQPAVTVDELQLVTGAACGASGGAVTSSSRGMVALFSLENKSGGYTAQCEAF
jgi:cbb3-type cytochrome oxidase subunit 3